MRANTSHDLAAAVRGRRRDLGWSQERAAHAAGVSRKWVSDVETGRTSPDLATMLRLLAGLGLVLDVSVGGEPPSSAGRAGHPGPSAGHPGPSADDVDLDAVLARYERP